MPTESPRLAKLSVPRVYDAVPRERLHSRLDELLGRHPCVWMAGPPGAGKSTLAASYVRDRRRQPIWYRVDPGDVELPTFFFYLGEAAAALDPGAPRLPLLTPDCLGDVPGFARRFFRALFAHGGSRNLLVLEDAQQLPDDVLGMLVSALVPEVPDGQSVLIASRRDPPDALGDLVASRHLVPLGWQELRFSREEATALAVASFPGSLPDIESVYAQSGGWAAGLVLILEHARSAVRHGTDHVAAPSQAVFDFFASRIHDQAGPVAQATLMMLSLAPSVTAREAERITDNPDAGRILEDLHRRHLFVDRTGGAEPACRLHDLFRAFLLERLSLQQTPDARAALARRIGQVLAAAGRREDAMPLLLDASDWPAAEDVIRDLTPVLLSQGRWRTLEDWIGRLPVSRLEQGPWLRYCFASAKMAVDLPGSRAEFSTAFARFEQLGERTGMAMASAAILAGLYLELDAFHRMDPWIDAMERLLGDGVTFPDAAAELFALSGIVMACAVRRPSSPVMRPSLRRATESLSGVADVQARFINGALLLAASTYVGEPARAQQIAEINAGIVDDPTIPPTYRVVWWTKIGFMHHIRAEPALAVIELDRATALAREYGVGSLLLLIRALKVYTLLSWGRLEAAEAVVRELDALLDPTRVMDRAHYHHAWCCLGLARMDGKLAAEHAILKCEAVRGIGSPFFSVDWFTLGAAGLVLGGELDRAAALLDEIHELMGSDGLGWYRPVVLFVEAYLALRQGERDLAHARLREGFAVGRADGTIWYVRWLMGVADLLFAEALRAGIEPEYVASLVRNYGMRPPADDIPAWPWKLRVHALGRFEVVVDGVPLRFERKTPQRPMQLLEAIVARGGADVPVAKLIDDLWSDEDGDSAAESFKIALHRLRKLLDAPEAIRLEGGRVSLDPAVAWVDALAFARPTAAGDGASPGLALYRGEFLPEDTDAPWTIPMRERLRDRFVRAVVREGARLESTGAGAEAIDGYVAAIDVDAVAEPVYQALIRCYLTQGRVAEASTAFRRLQSVLSATLGTAPSRDTQALLANVRAEGARADLH